MPSNPYLIHAATIVEKRQEASDIVSFRPQLTDPDVRKQFYLKADQFNRLYGFGVGKVEIGPPRIEPGDHVIISEDLGSHGIAAMNVREGLSFSSDSTPLHEVIVD